MATCTAGVTANSTTNNAALTTGSFTPAASDLLVAFAVVTGQASGGVFTDSQTLGWEEVAFPLKASSADTLVVAVANTAAAASSMTVTFTPAGSPTSTGVAISVVRVSGMTRLGWNAVRQVQFQQNQSSATPAPVFPQAALTGNPCLGAVANATNPAGMTAPSGWSELHDTGYATPTTGLETVAIDSGFTGTTVTWGSSSASAFCSAIIELDTTAYPSPPTMTTNLVSEWLMGTNAAAQPDSIDGLPLAVPASISTSAGLTGTASSFAAASSQYMQPPKFRLAEAWGFSVWFKPTSTALGSNWARVIDWGTGTSLYLFVTLKSGTRTVPSVGLLYGGTEYQAGATPTAFVAGTWYHLVVSGTGNRVTTYINGATTGGIASWDASGSNLGTLTNAYIGKSQYPDPYYDGLMQYATLFSRELTLQDAQSLYNNGTPASPASLTRPVAPVPNSNGRAPYQLFTFDQVSTEMKLCDSYDGVYWVPYTITYTPASSGIVRDPFGFFVGSDWYVCHTRLFNSADSFAIAKATTGALTTWNPLVLVDCSAVVGSGGSKNVWAPKAVRNRDSSTWLDTSGKPMITFAGTTDINTVDFQIYYVQPNSADPSTWGSAANWGTPALITGSALPADTIDASITWMGGNTFKMWVKDEGNNINKLLTSTSGDPTTGWDTIVTDPGGWGTDKEGVGAFQLPNTSRWLITTDPTDADRGLQYAISDDDFATVSPLAGISNSILARHGNIVYNNAPAGDIFQFNQSVKRSAYW